VTRQYLQRQEFIIKTDHKSLAYLNKHNVHSDMQRKAMALFFLRAGYGSFDGTTVQDSLPQRQGQLGSRVVLGGTFKGSPNSISSAIIMDT